jgi:hypothetical protein
MTGPCKKSSSPRSRWLATVSFVALASATGCTVLVESKLEEQVGDDGLLAQDGDAATPAGDAQLGSGPDAFVGRDGEAKPPLDDAASAPGSGDVSAWAAVDGGTDAGAGVVPTDAGLPSGPRAGGATAKLCVGMVHACGLMPSGTIDCWGNNDEGQLGLRGTSARYTDLTCGDHHTCAISTDGAIACVGRNRESQRQSPAGSDFAQVAAGKAHTCALKKDGTVQCWGGLPDALGVSAAPSEPLLAIAAGDQVSCGILRSNGAVTCWGNPASGRTKGVSSLDNVSLDLGGAQGCAVSRSGQVACWGEGAEYALGLTEARAVSVARSGRGCGLLADGVQCWYGSQTLAWPGKFRAIAAGPGATCRLPEDGAQLECVGDEGLQYEQLETLVPKPYPRSDEVF